MDIEKLGKLRILYVEDEINLRETTVLSLNAIVKYIDVASNGKEGLEKFNHNEYDIIITDLSMPVMDGIEMIKNIRKLDNNIPIVVTTAFGSQNEEIEQLQNVGMSEYLIKPIDMIKLVTVIEDLT